MKVISTPIKDLLILEPKVYKDERGFFMESFNHKEFESLINKQVNFVQDNHSKSVHGVLRGMHFQTAPYAQGKLVRCVLGEIYDVAIDLRRNSPTYKEYYGVILSSENHRQMWIPEGFAHGFIVLSDNAEFLYKTTNYYNPASERCLRWDDAEINIQWPLQEGIVISEKDKNGSAFSSLENDFF
ncbi:TPA: dTDP-4-dehydrorhamnose 3,5-epimerase [Enterobacter cloacae]|uniref:dTDP-4-dehydrorhamnose 3,5-epimerase n=1 Tax=Enterobacter cloacae TaxID=550 RepID=UPI0018C34F64|nr:dTDP-4-dehydrorhamnose 3,5-epimerase [Enterobacter cloacae]MBG0521697.1 dTDP-4-dehydrorhamnose 3,5-epimerase [Enterobacter cloacae]MCU6283533.1 dTDP-4-dehydrorhamnose 3,5-epimerase [Enterobacter cloacae]